MQTAVVIPVYNRPELLLRALDSVLRQSCQPDEIVVVDDCSTVDMAKVRELVEDAGGKWMRLTKNAGPAAARNAGAEATNAHWITFLDSDDEWEERKLEAQLRWHAENSGNRISQVGERWFRNGGEVRKKEHQIQQGGDLFEDACKHCAIAPSCVMISRDLWEEHGGFDERFAVCEDYELWLRITASEKVGLVPEDLVRRHGGHDDQLSKTTIAMDRFRVLALLEILYLGGLGAGKEAVVRREIEKKSQVLAQGAKKRGLKQRGDFYERLSALEKNDPADYLDDAWAQVEEI